MSFWRWRRSILFTILVSLIISSLPASAVTITDDAEDVMYYGEYQLDTVANKPNLDITSVSYSITGSEITLTMTVKGIIEDSDLISYVIHFGTVDENGSFYFPCKPGYQVVYSNNYGAYSYFGLDGFSMEQGDYGELTNPVSGNTFTATFEIAHFDPAFEVSGMIMGADPMHATDEELAFFWMDVTSNLLSFTTGEDDEDDNDEDESDIDEGDEDTTGDDEDIITPNGDDTGGDGNGDTGGGTPGFEIITFMVAITIMFIILKRKKL
jgi:hypothetical protein